MDVKSLEIYVSNVLRAGVLISGFLIVIGLGLYFITGDVCYPNGESSLHWIIYGDPFFAPSHIIFVGFLTLVVTPLLRVGASVIAYVIERDWPYVAITGFVLLTLVLGLVLGLSK
jgi:uncharacterized membrane protein